MRSSLQTRRRSLRTALALLGVAAGTVVTVVAPVPRAEAIGGGVASVSQPTSPRETTGATPSVSLFQTSASSYTGGGGSSSGNGPSAEVTSRGSTSSNRDTGGGTGEDRPAGSSGRRRRAAAAPADSPDAREESRPESAGRRRTAARREREEGRSREGTAVARQSNGKDAVDRKNKNVIVPPPADRPIFTIGAGWQSRYIYHGQDIVSFNSAQSFPRFAGFDANGLPVITRKFIQPESSSIWFTNFLAEYKGFQLKLDYVQAVDSTVPFLQGSPGTSSVPGFIVNADGTVTFPNKRRIYRELDPGLSYTLGIGNLFDATVGYTFFLFPNDDFKGTHYEGETLVKLTYKQFKFLKPSFLYFHYNSPYSELQAGDLNGSFVQFRVDGDLPIIDQPRLSVRLQPYALGNYNINFLRYNGSDIHGNPTNEVGGWSSFETGLKVPITIAKRFTVTPFGNYGINIADEENAPINNFTKRGFGEKTRFWGGVNLSLNF